MVITVVGKGYSKVSDRGRCQHIARTLRQVTPGGWIKCDRNNPSTMTGCDGIAILESKHMLRTLLFLLDNGKSTKMEVYNAVSKNPKMPDKIADLQYLGLLTVVTEDRSSVIELTDKGRAVAEQLRIIRDML